MPRSRVLAHDDELHVRLGGRTGADSGGSPALGAVSRRRRASKRSSRWAIFAPAECQAICSTSNGMGRPDLSPGMALRRCRGTAATSDVRGLVRMASGRSSSPEGATVDREAFVSAVRVIRAPGRSSSPLGATTWIWRAMCGSSCSRWSSISTAAGLDRRHPQKYRIHVATSSCAVRIARGRGSECPGTICRMACGTGRRRSLSGPESSGGSTTPTPVRHRSMIVAACAAAPHVGALDLRSSGGTGAMNRLRYQTDTSRRRVVGMASACHRWRRRRVI